MSSLESTKGIVRCYDTSLSQEDTGCTVLLFCPQLGKAIVDRVLSIDDTTCHEELSAETALIDGKAFDRFKVLKSHVEWLISDVSLQLVKEQRSLVTYYVV